MIWTILFIVFALITAAVFVFAVVKGKGFETAMRMLITNVEILDELAKKSPNKIDDKIMEKVKRVLRIEEPSSDDKK
jgi:hypothetical protein